MPSEPNETPGRDVFRVLFLCTGNSCRSPIATGLFKNLVKELPVEVVSAGTMERVPSPATREAIEVAAELGADIRAHRSQPLSAIKSEKVDLVLGFEREHVAKAVVEAGFPAEATFTLEEITDLLEKVSPTDGLPPAEAARAAVRRAAKARPAHVRAIGKEIEDPIGRPISFYRSTGDRINELTRRLADQLFGPCPSG